MITEGVRELNWNSPELGLPKPGFFKTFYAPSIGTTGLTEGLKKISDGHIIKGLGYGSTFSGVSSPDSLIDMLVIVRSTRAFYNHLSQVKGVHLGTINNAWFHDAWNDRKVNFYSGRIEVDGVTKDMKMGVIGHRRFLEHARGGRPDAMGSGEGKGYLYLAGRLHKAVLVPVFSETTPLEQAQIDMAINQARIDGTMLV